MGRLKIKKNSRDKKLIWTKVRHYIDFVILVCCLVVTFNIHPKNENINDEGSLEKQKMIYIFHDYAGNEYIMNDTLHGAADSWDYLFEDEVPSDLKWEQKEFTDSVSLSNISQDNNQIKENTWDDSNIQTSVKDNQVSLKDMMIDLWVDDKVLLAEKTDNNQLIVDLSDSWAESDLDEPYYIVTEETWNDESKLIIEKIEDSEYSSDLPAKIFTFTEDGWVLPILVSRDKLNLKNSSGLPIAYIDNSWYTYESAKNNSSGVTIIGDYADCMTPWWYKIDHGDSVWAYQQMDNAPNICNIERRFCRNGKLSWTYTQQWCSVNKNYTYEQWGEAEVNSNTDNNKNNGRTPNVKQNPDWSVTVNQPLWTGSFVFDRPSKSSTPEYHVSDNVKVDEEVEQTDRPHRDCTTPRWEKVRHGNFVQAFKHANWFADAPCEMQIRLCTMWNLMGTYTESTCKTRDASFIDWVNWYPNWDKSSKEKIEWIKKQIENEQADYEKARKTAWRSTKTDQLDKILYLLDKN